MSLWRGAIYPALMERKLIEGASIATKAGWCFIPLIVKIAS